MPRVLVAVLVVLSSALPGVAHTRPAAPWSRPFAADTEDFHDWYVLGRIAEQYGALDAARKAYERVRTRPGALDESLSCWLLARRRLEGLPAAPATPPGPKPKPKPKLRPGARD